MLPDITIELDRPIEEYTSAQIIALVTPRFMRMWNTDENSLRTIVHENTVDGRFVECLHWNSYAAHRALIAPGTRTLEFYPQHRPQARIIHADDNINFLWGNRDQVMREDSFVMRVTYK